MMLYLMRHAEALSTVAARVGSDALRPLSPAGEQTASRVGETLRRRGVRPDQILVSPLLRARQTADGVAVAMGCLDRVESCEALLPDGDPGWFIELLQQEDVERVLLAVGHNPLLGDIAGKLVGSDGIALPPAGVLWLHLREAPGSWRGVIRARWTPEDLTTPPGS